MSTILAVDTATTACSVALRHRGKSFQRSEFARRSHTQLVLPMIDSLLQEAGVELRDLQAIAFTHGPGSFTGIRIGFGVIQGLAFAAGVSVIPVSTLGLLAATAARKLRTPRDALILPALDARMDEIYGAGYRVAGGALQPVIEDFVSRPDDADWAALDEPGVGVGEGWLYADRINHKPASLDTTLLPEAIDMLAPAELLFEAGAAVEVDSVQPVYLRDTVTWKKRQRLR